MSDAAALARAFLSECETREVMIATAESCTGGGIIAALTDIAGSSASVDRGFVTYSNAAKTDMLGVARETLDRFGAVSEEVALEMAQGALARSAAGIALAVTGIAGPGGGSAQKPVGLVWIAVATTGPRATARRFLFAGKDRDGVRRATVVAALEMGLERLRAASV